MNTTNEQMNNMKHTPGPWLARRDIKNRGWMAVYALNLDLIVDMMSDDEFQEGDAHLIAAAPEILEALEELVSSLPQRRDWLNPDLERFAKAAIAKATGKESA